MQTSWSFNCGVLLLCATLCSGQNVTKPNGNQPAIKVKIYPQSSTLESSTSSSSTTTTTTTTPNPKGNPTPKSSIPAHEIEEDDYNFHNDRLPELTEDEYNNLSEDANPLHFLKHQPLDLESDETKPPQSEKEEQEPQAEKQESPSKTQPESPVAAPQLPSSPIYITIPIYISTGGKLPVTLTIGDQEVSLKKASGSGSSRKNPSTKAPNSHFNRLLQQIESPKRRTTNRHRSQLKSHIHALEERKNRRDLVYHPMD
ncbi:ataxin-2 homolog [Drosophila eugracilis]|uniref:ataxin-2 homolog n=1 Tax=Drosophila eugracilis TaxID=29029 RepID=UPI001BD9E627|nr:ataxin-2 homolog [Drosophila eugracilis]